MTQFIRKIDRLGRIVLPAEYRKKSGIEIGSEVKITESDGNIIIERLAPYCKVCGAEENIDEKFCICRACIEEIKKS